MVGAMQNAIVGERSLRVSLFHLQAEHFTAEHAQDSGPDVLERNSDQEGHETAVLSSERKFSNRVQINRGR